MYTIEADALSLILPLILLKLEMYHLYQVVQNGWEFNCICAKCTELTALLLSYYALKVKISGEIWTTDWGI